MFALTQTFTHATGFHITPLEMEGVGFIFLPKELEIQLGYDDLSKTIRQSESFADGIEYLVLRDSKLMCIKELLRRTNTIGSVSFKYANSLAVLTEPGLYTAMILSRKPNAQIFRRWVTSEVLPSIRKTGGYKIASTTSNNLDILELSTKIDALQKAISEQHQVIRNFAHILNKQEQFRDYALCAFERMEAVLAESLPHDMFEGWRKIKNIVNDMTKIYGLSEMEQKRYIQELCQSHNVPLPEKAFLGNESLFLDLQEIAIKLGVYSMANKPHSRLVVALIRHLGLDSEKYCYNCGPNITKYSDKVIPHIGKWLQENKYPKSLKLICGKAAKEQKFQVRYKIIPTL